MNLTELAKRMGVNRSTARHLIDRGLIPDGVCKGHSPRVFSDDEAALAVRRVKSLLAAIKSQRLRYVEEAKMFVCPACGECESVSPGAVKSHMRACAAMIEVVVTANPPPELTTELRGRYMGMMHALPQSEKARIKALVQEQGYVAAIEEMTRMRAERPKRAPIARNRSEAGKKAAATRKRREAAKKAAVTRSVARVPDAPVTVATCATMPNGEAPTRAHLHKLLDGVVEQRIEWPALKAAVESHRLQIERLQSELAALTGA